MYNNKTFECFMVLGFGCGCFQELGWKVASKLYLTSMLSLPTILILSLFLSFLFFFLLPWIVAWMEEEVVGYLGMIHIFLHIQLSAYSRGAGTCLLQV